MLESRIDDCWNIDGSRDLSDSLDRFHSVYSTGRKALQTDICGPRETDKTASDIQARSFMGRTLDDIGKKCQAEGIAKVV